jgi:hypothetical protein
MNAPFRQLAERWAAGLASKNVLAFFLAECSGNISSCEVPRVTSTGVPSYGVRWCGSV